MKSAIFIIFLFYSVSNADRKFKGKYDDKIPSPTVIQDALSALQSVPRAISNPPFSKDYPFKPEQLIKEAVPSDVSYMDVNKGIGSFDVKKYGELVIKNLFGYKFDYVYGNLYVILVLLAVYSFALYNFLPLMYKGQLKSPEYLTCVVCYVGYFAPFTILYALNINLIITSLLPLLIVYIVYPYTLKSCQILSKIPDFFFVGYRNDTIGWFVARRAAYLLTANFIYQLMSLVLPYRFGLVGIIIKSSKIFATIAYILVLVTSVQGLFMIPIQDKNNDCYQTAVVSLISSYVVLSAVSFIFNISQIASGIVALDVPLFFSVYTNLNIDFINVSAFLLLFGTVYFTMKRQKLAQSQGETKNDIRLIKAQ